MVVVGGVEVVEVVAQMALGKAAGGFSQVSRRAEPFSQANR